MWLTTESIGVGRGIHDQIRLGRNASARLLQGAPLTRFRLSPPRGMADLGRNRLRATIVFGIRGEPRSPTPLRFNASRFRGFTIVPPAGGGRHSPFVGDPFHHPAFEGSEGAASPWVVKDPGQSASPLFHGDSACPRSRKSFTPIRIGRAVSRRRTCPSPLNPPRMIFPLGFGSFTVHLVFCGRTAKNQKVKTHPDWFLCTSTKTRRKLRHVPRPVKQFLQDTAGRRECKVRAGFSQKRVATHGQSESQSAMQAARGHALSLSHSPPAIMGRIATTSTVSRGAPSPPLCRTSSPLTQDQGRFAQGIPFETPADENSDPYLIRKARSSSSPEPSGRFAPM